MKPWKQSFQERHCEILYRNRGGYEVGCHNVGSNNIIVLITVLTVLLKGA